MDLGKVPEEIKDSFSTFHSRSPPTHPWSCYVTLVISCRNNPKIGHRSPLWKFMKSINLKWGPFVWFGESNLSYAGQIHFPYPCQLIIHQVHINQGKASAQLGRGSNAMLGDSDLFPANYRGSQGDLLIWGICIQEEKSRRDCKMPLCPTAGMGDLWPSRCCWTQSLASILNMSTQKTLLFSSVGLTPK